MLLRTVFILYLHYGSVFPYLHEKPIAQTVWPGRCLANQRVLNDCNWCVCNKRNHFSCQARLCQEIDMFGHFNDAIREHIVGMEGHGSWRSNDTSCQPRMHYQREGLLCVCDDDGNWPSPVCRDLFRVLHQVELTGHERPSALHECRPRHLYLYGCNVCLCPPEGRIDPDSCTRQNCSDDDPLLQPSQQPNTQDENLSEVYAECTLDRKYIVGCRRCKCLKNNRLLCDNCDLNAERSGNEGDYCENKDPFLIFNIECNTCICDERGLMYCTTRRCLSKTLKPGIELSKSVDLTLRTVDAPLDSHECVLGTKYRKECNACFCTETSDRKKSLSCTLKKCRSSSARKPDALSQLQDECVESTVYEANCLLCRCDVVDGVKRESCLLNSVCSNDLNIPNVRSTDLNSMHGYCEPAHVYHKDCNTCKCLSDGKVAACSSKVCSQSRQQPLEVDVIPVRQRGAARCPRDHMYKVDCNFCFCLKNGNLLCTTAKCDELE